MYNSGTVYTSADLRYDFQHGADVLFDYKDMPYGLFFFLDVLADGSRTRDIYIGPSGEHKTRGYTDPDTLLSGYVMHDGATLREALPDIRITHHS